MTPKLLPIPKPLGGLYLQEEITAAWVSTVSAQLTPLAIATVEEWYPQTSGRAVRDYMQDELPALWVYVLPDTTDELAAALIEVRYSIHWGIAVADGNIRTAVRVLERIREEVIVLFSSWDMQGTTDFLTESGTSCRFGGFTSARPNLESENPYFIWTDDRMSIWVAVANPIYE